MSEWFSKGTSNTAPSRVAYFLCHQLLLPQFLPLLTHPIAEHLYTYPISDSVIYVSSLSSRNTNPKLDKG
ncbi:hypothetical protein Hanom_Chr16g01422911 [Helianthus anomalus]